MKSIILTSIMAVTTYITFAQSNFSYIPESENQIVISTFQGDSDCQKPSGVYLGQENDSNKICDLKTHKKNDADASFVSKNNATISKILRTYYDQNYYLQSLTAFPEEEEGCGLNHVYVLAKIDL